MPFPNVNPLIETFLEPSRIFLFGKPFPTLTYDPNPMSAGTDAQGQADSSKVEFATYDAPAAGGSAQPALPMPPGRVEQALRQAQNGGIFARIYGFSFEGHYYKLPRPVLFLVDGEGYSGDSGKTGLDNAAEFSTRFTGVEGKDWQFGRDIRVWAVDKHDIAVCLDLDVATYDEILLQSRAGGQEESAFRTGAAARTGAASRTGAAFRTGAVGLHQDR